MDRRIFILPVISLALFLAILARPDITGFTIASPSGPQDASITPNVSISIGKDGFIPEGSVVTVSLDGRVVSMEFAEFVTKSGEGYEIAEGRVPGINYEGEGYVGSYTYSLDISEFGLDTDAGEGGHTLSVRISYGEHVFSESSQVI